MLWIVAEVCSRMISEISGINTVLLECPSSFPAASGSYSDCTFSGRTSRVFNVTSGTLTLRSCVFTDCTNSNGAGGCIYSTGTLNVYSCSFTSCKTVNHINAAGGAIYSEDASSSSVIEDSECSECSASWAGGALCFHSAAQCTVRNCQFTACESSGASGGAICQYDSGQIMTITSCTFVNCKEKDTMANSHLGGGAIRCSCGTADIDQCSFDGCSALKSGGAICCFSDGSLSVSVSHSEIRNCSASNGGGGISCYRYKSSPTLSISYLTITDCTAASSLGQAIHIYSYGSFTWDHLCITGTGTLVKADDSSPVPTEAELKEECVALFTQKMQSLRSLRFAVEVFMMCYILS